MTLRGGHERRDQLQRGAIGPLQIVQKNYERMGGLSEDLDEVLKNPLEPILSLGGWQGRRFRL